MSVRTLSLDLTKSATRQSIFGQVVMTLPEDERMRPAQVLRDASTPKTAHLADMAAVEHAIGISVASTHAKDEARDIYRILAEAEAKVHGCDIADIHFHEVGLGLTLREILACAMAIEAAGPEEIVCTPVQVGSGTVTCEHGTFDVPAPATQAIIDEYGIPICDTKRDGELLTPTSAAILAHYVTRYEPATAPEPAAAPEPATEA